MKMANMINRYNKFIISIFIPFVFISSAAKAEILQKQSCCSIVPAGHFTRASVVGAANNPTLTQTGTAFFPAASGGPLAVNAQEMLMITQRDRPACWLRVGCLTWQWSVDVHALEPEGYYLGSPKWRFD